MAVSGRKKIDLNAAADGRGIDREVVLAFINKCEAPKQKLSNQEVLIKLVFGDVPQTLQDTPRTPTRNAHPELVRHPTVVATAKRIMSANRKRKVAELNEQELEVLRTARRIVRWNQRNA